MSKMVKRVAQAICKSKTCEGISCCQWPAQAARRHKCPVEAGAYDDAARDAITSMREPTDPMICAVLDLHDSAAKTFRVSDDWRAMIDEALK
jgi:hypothetical protein